MNQANSVVIITPGVLQNGRSGNLPTRSLTSVIIDTHAVLDVVIDYELAFFCGEAVVFCQNTVDLVDNRL